MTSRRSAALMYASHSTIRTAASDILSVRSWWNTCLRPLPRPAGCHCIRSFHSQLTGSSLSRPSFSLHSPRSLPSPSPLPYSRFFSSPSIASISSPPPPPPLPSPSPSPVSLPDSIQLTDAASRRIAQLRSKYGPSMHLRLSIDSGGCSGLSYKFEIDTEPPQSDDVEIRVEEGGGGVLVDRLSLDMVKGSIIDYTVKIERSGFEVVKNPNSAARCGCGSSFQPKEF